jgi:heme A synthase
MTLPRFARYAWAVLAANLAVVAWGAYVRASGSGAGCGAHWPLCDGEVIPSAPGIAKLVEFSHRATSGIAFVLVVGLWWWARRAFAPGSHVRRAAAWSLGFMVLEAALGAGLVKFELVAQNKSLFRACSLALHLVNTFILLAWLALTAWWASGPTLAPKWVARPRVSLALATGLGLTLLVGVTGAVTALGDTLFPATSLSAGLAQDLNPTADVLLRLRVWHPAMAVLTGVYLLAFAGWGSIRQGTGPVADLGRLLGALVVFQWGLGVTNLMLLAPVPLQLGHLLVADLVWIALVLFGSALLGAAPARVERPAAAPLAAPVTADR